MKKILICGASGLLGTSLSLYLKSYDFKVLTQSRGPGYNIQSDFSSIDQTKSLLQEINPDIIINLIACTNVDLCEKNPHLAYSSNILPVINLVNSYKDLSCFPHLIQLSTDQVYDGPGLHTEIDISPSNTYSITKFASELYASKVNATILRTNFFGPSKSPGKHSFSDWILNTLKEGCPASFFHDINFSPLHIHTLCSMIKTCIDLQIPGTYNLGSSSSLSKAQFALNVAELFELSASHVRLISKSEHSFEAYRPFNMAMDVSLFESTYGVSLPSLTTEISKLASF